MHTYTHTHIHAYLQNENVKYKYGVFLIENSQWAAEIEVDSLLSLPPAMGTGCYNSAAPESLNESVLA